VDIPKVRTLGDVEALICQVGADFDPARPGRDYLTPAGGRRFTDEQATRLDTAVASAARVCEQAGVGLAELARRVVDELRHGPWPTLGEMVVLLVGSPLDGLHCYGPFPTGDSVDAEHRDLRHDYWWIGGLEQLELPAADATRHRVEVAMALLDAAADADGEDRPRLAGRLTEVLWQLRAVQLHLEAGSPEHLHDPADPDRCPTGPDGQHQPDPATVSHGRDTPDGVVDVNCRHCGRSGSLLLDPEAVQW
jgi:hypothetical protein